MSSLEDKLIINAALTGMVPTKDDNPHVPISSDEIVEDVLRCYDAGASIFHLHARDEGGKPTYRLEAYHDIMTKLRRACPDDLVVCLTTSGRLFNTFDKRSEVLNLPEWLKPDMASLTLGSLNFPKQASVNAPDMIRQLAEKMLTQGIVPELEVFEQGMIDFSTYLIRKAVLRPPFYCNILLGSLGSLSATPANLAAMVAALPKGATWAATGIGRYQFRVNTWAITTGGHVRVGLEDAIYMDQGKRDPASNPRLVDRLVRVARAVGREPATPAEARRMIGLPKQIPAGVVAPGSNGSDV